MSLHITPPVAFDAGWLAGTGLPPEHGRDLIRLLDALQRSSSLREAARVCGLSYRHAWGLLREGAAALGGARGRGPRPWAGGGPRASPSCFPAGRVRRA